MMTIRDLRKQINTIDDDIRRLFLLRLDLSRQIGDLKRELDLPIYDPKREQEILKHQRQMINNDALWIYFKPLYEKILEISKQVQE